MAEACPFCGSDLGFYNGPNGKQRCLQCFMEEGGTPTKEEAATVEPNRQVEDKAEPTPLTQSSPRAKDKSLRGPKEPEPSPAPAAVSSTATEAEEPAKPATPPASKPKQSKTSGKGTAT